MTQPPANSVMAPKGHNSSRHRSRKDTYTLFDRNIQRDLYTAQTRHKKYNLKNTSCSATRTAHSTC